MKMKRVFLLMAMALMLALNSSGIAGAWIIGKAPSLEYGPEKLKEHAEETCLADLEEGLRHESYVAADPAKRASCRKLWWAMKRKRASLVVEDVSYKLGKFEEFRNTGVMGWFLHVRGKSKAVMATPQGELKFEKRSSVVYFIWVREGDSKQIIDLPENVAPFSNWGWGK